MRTLRPRIPEGMVALITTEDELNKASRVRTPQGICLTAGRERTYVKFGPRAATVLSGLCLLGVGVELCQKVMWHSST
jgi:hypothetical protein